MNRIDRQRLNTARFPVVINIATRFDDLDMQGHINHAAGAIILQEARNRLTHASEVTPLPEGMRTMVAAITIEYAAEMHYPDPVDVSTGILSIGRTSFTICQIARQNSKPTLYAQVTLVVAKASGPVPIPASQRAAYEQLLLT